MASVDGQQPLRESGHKDKGRKKKKPRTKQDIKKDLQQADDDVVIEEVVTVTASAAAPVPSEKKKRSRNRNKEKPMGAEPIKDFDELAGQAVRNHISERPGSAAKDKRGKVGRGRGGHHSHHQAQGHHSQGHFDEHGNFSIIPSSPNPGLDEFFQQHPHLVSSASSRAHGHLRGKGHPKNQSHYRGQHHEGYRHRNLHGHTNRHGSSTESGGAGNKQGEKTKRQPKFSFEPYWPKEKVQEGLKRGELIEGRIRINPKNYEDSYIAHPDGKSDVYIPGLAARNRALEGDIVVVKIKNRNEWKVLMDEVECGEKSLADCLNALDLGSHSRNSSVTGCNDEDCETKGVKMDNKNVADLEKGTGSLTATDVTGVSMEDKLSDENKHQDESKEKTKQEKTQDKKVKSKEEKGNNDKPNGRSGRKPENTPRKRYTSLQDMVMAPSTSGSLSVRRLFDDSYRTKSEAAAAKVTQVTDNEQKIMDAVADKFLLRTGMVVFITEAVHSRAFTGHIKLMQDGNKELALFSPADHRMPRLFVSMLDCPADFYERSEDYANTLFVGRMTEWPENSQFAKGMLARSLGEAGEIEPETEGLLISYGINFDEFPEQALACLPQVSPEVPWVISDQEYQTRRDLRQECIFTIDPATARDLDDALHCKPLGNGQYEVGVHIADVSYFVDFDSNLDKVARSRSTSVYLVQKVIPMLPRLLCEKLCSLNPDEDRLTFSVIWKMDKHGKITDEWFGRTIIRSCCKLSYEHAQGFIEEPDREWQANELPPISTGFTIPMIVERVLNLHKIADSLRRKRFDGGALRLDQVKLQYTLDKATGLPNGYSVYRQRESNRLVEEFMLLANMAVAHQIYRHFPELALLRRHPEPQSKMIQDLEMQCAHLGVALDCSSAGAINQSIVAFAGDDLDSMAKQQILVVLCSKPMQNALYFCTGCLENEELYRHYALNVPLYTHFTSPIRRYPDIMVHRLLAASLGYCDLPALSKNDAQQQADHSNRKKYDAKRVSELSSDLFFAVFVKECGPLEEQGMVMGVLDKAIDVLILKLGVVKRVYMEQLPLVNFSFTKEQKTPKLRLIWSTDEAHPVEKGQLITIFTRVHCVLSADPKWPLKWNAIIKHPDDD